MNERKYETMTVTSCENLKQPKIYFFLKESGISENYIKKLRNNSGSILKNDLPATTRDKIENGDIIKIQKDIGQTDIAECDGNLSIIFEDDDFLIVNKPHNLSCTPSKSHFYDNLGGQICKYLGKDFVLRILGRLDRETAGIVVLAKNIIATKQTFEKTYFALCHGEINQEIVIEAPILTIQKDGINELKRVISPKGKYAKTIVTPVQSNPNFSLVKLYLLTGRTHQIRVHMAHIGHPLLGDSIYGIKDKAAHTMLVMKELSFTHFRTGQKINLTVPFPEEWVNYIK